jgi:hypothetical protein
VFGHLLGLRTLNSRKGPSIHKQTFFPITFDGIGLIPTATYLGSWAFVASTIIVRFMVNQHPFLLEALA